MAIKCTVTQPLCHKQKQHATMSCSKLPVEQVRGGSVGGSGGGSAAKTAAYWRTVAETEGVLQALMYAHRAVMSQTSGAGKSWEEVTLLSDRISCIREDLDEIAAYKASNYATARPKCMSADYAINANVLAAYGDADDA